MGNSGELISVFSDITSINSGTPCGSSVSGPSGPPGFAATAITGHSLNLANRRKKKQPFLFPYLASCWQNKLKNETQLGLRELCEWALAETDWLCALKDIGWKVERQVTGWVATTVKLHSISLLGPGLVLNAHLVFSSVLWSLLVIFSMAACLLSAGSRSVLFRTTTMRGQVSSPISRHSAVCVWTPFTTSTTSIIRSMIWAPAEETRFRPERRLCQLLGLLENIFLRWFDCA